MAETKIEFLGGPQDGRSVSKLALCSSPEEECPDLICVPHRHKPGWYAIYMFVVDLVDPPFYGFIDYQDHLPNGEAREHEI